MIHHKHFILCCNVCDAHGTRHSLITVCSTVHTPYAEWFAVFDSVAVIVDVLGMSMVAADDEVDLGSNRVCSSWLERLGWEVDDIKFREKKT